MTFEGGDANLFVTEKQISIPIPSLPSPEPDLNITSKWLENESDPNLRRIKKKMADSITNVPFSTFREELKNVGEKFNETVGDTPHIVLWDNKPHGSKRWVHSLVEPSVESTARLATYMKKPETVVEQLEQSGTDTIVVFDDAVYSGDQLSDSLYVPLWNYLHEVKYPKMLNMVLCIPYASEIFGYMVRKDWDDNTIRTRLISSKTIPSLWDILTDEEQDALRAVNLRLNVPEAGDNPDDTKFQPINFGPTVTTFDHKIPDMYSVCRPLLVSVGIDIKQRREPYKIKGTPYWDMEKKEYGIWLDDLV